MYLNSFPGSLRWRVCSMSCDFTSNSHHVSQLTLCSRANHIVIGVFYLMSYCAHVMSVSFAILLLQSLIVFCIQTDSWLNVSYSNQRFKCFHYTAASFFWQKKLNLVRIVIYCMYKCLFFLNSITVEISPFGFSALISIC